MDCHFPFGSVGNVDFHFVAVHPEPLISSFLNLSLFSKFKKNKKIVPLEGKQRPRKESGLLSWLAVVLGLFIFSFVFREFWTEWEKRKAIDKEVEALQQEINKLSQEKSGMQEALRYLKTSEFQEKELKDKLNLVKEGEAVVYVREKNLSEQPTEEKTEKSEENQEAQVSVKKPNYYYWWKYFFQMR